jgi:hypothetical protein
MPPILPDSANFGQELSSLSNFSQDSASLDNFGKVYGGVA